VEGPGEIHLQDGIPFFFRHFSNGSIAKNPGIVHQQIEPAAISANLFHHGLNFTCRADVATVCPRARNGARHGFGIRVILSRGIVHVVHETLCAAFAQGGDDAGANAARAAGDECDLSGEVMGDHPVKYANVTARKRRTNLKARFQAIRARVMPAPIRILTAVPICDGHDSAINTINLELIRHGVEVVYLGYNRSARDIVRAAVQEDVRAIGISSYNGGHVEFFSEVLALLKKQRASQIGVFGGGGGTITAADAAKMCRAGVDRIFFAGTPLEEMVGYVRKTFGRPRSGAPDGGPLSLRRDLKNGNCARCIGVTGPGGAGKTTLIDELVLRFLKTAPRMRIAILSHDPSIVGKGALLGDRAAMIYSQDDRVFMRSLASRGRAGGLAPETKDWLAAMKRGDFGLVLVETVGVGQEAMPFRASLVDKTVFVLSPEYGSRLQLQKIAMLGAADVVVVNKADAAGAKAAIAEVEQRLSAEPHPAKIIATTASRHRDAGVDRLMEELKT